MEATIFVTWKPGLNDCVYDVFVDYNTINVSNIVNIHKYLIKSMI